MADTLPTVPGKDWLVFAFKVFLATFIINAAFDLLGIYGGATVKPKKWFNAPFTTWQNRNTATAPAVTQAPATS